MLHNQYLYHPSRQEPSRKVTYHGGTRPVLDDSSKIQGNRDFENLEKSIASSSTRLDINPSQLQIEVDYVNEDVSIIQCTKEATSKEVGGASRVEKEIVHLNGLERLLNPNNNERWPILLEAQKKLSPLTGPNVKGFTREYDFAGTTKWKGRLSK